LIKYKRYSTPLPEIESVRREHHNVAEHAIDIRALKDVVAKKW